MSTPFKTKYEFDTTAHKGLRETRIIICADAQLGANGEGSVHFWIEKRHPETFDYESREAVPAYTESIIGKTVYSHHLVHDHEKGYTADEEAWYLRELVLTVARGDVGAKSASSLLWYILSKTAVRNREKWLRENAMEWFDLVDPKRDR